MKVYITKYALSRGIQERETTSFSEGTAVIHENGMYIYYRGNDWHRTREEAIERAEEMRSKQIKLLKERLRRLEGKTFK